MGPFEGVEYELIRIVLHSVLAYKLSKILIVKLKLNQKFNSSKPIKIFFLTYLICNSFIVLQYSSRFISNFLINREMRNNLNCRVTKLGPAGWGYECDSLNYAEFTELTKCYKLIEIPKEASAIFVHNWRYLSAISTVEFNVPKNIIVQKFYLNDSIEFRYTKELKEIEYLNGSTLDEDGLTRNVREIELDTTIFKRYKYVSES